MRRRVGLLLVFCAAGIGLGVAGGRILCAQPPSGSPPAVAETVLMRADLAGLPGKELIVSRLAAEPGWRHGRHRHVGHELVYVLEGTGTLEADGEGPVSLGQGAALYVPPGRGHSGGNASSTTSFRFLLVRIHDKGQPMSVELE